MGAWGVGPFDNDDALQFIDVLTSTSAGIVAVALDAAASFPLEECLEATEGAMAVAAAEVVAAALDQPTPVVPAAVRAWVAGNRDRLDIDLTAPMAREAVARVEAVDSELRELWEESDQLDAWRDAMTDLRARLRAATRPG